MCKIIKHEGEINLNINQEKQYINNKMQEIEKEQARLADLHKGLKDCADELVALENRGITEITLSEYVALRANEISATVEAEKIIEAVEPKPEVKEEKSVQLKAKYPISGLRNRDTLDRDLVASTIISVLRTEKTPMHLQELYKKVNKKFNGKIGQKNFQNNLLPRIMKSTGQVERARTKGYYQYKSV